MDFVKPKCFKKKVKNIFSFEFRRLIFKTRIGTVSALLRVFPQSFNLNQ